MFPQRATAFVQEYGWHLGLPVRRNLRLCGLNVERQWTGVFAKMAMTSCSMGLSFHMAIQLVALYGVARCATIFRRRYWYLIPIGGLIPFLHYVVAPAAQVDLHWWTWYLVFLSLG